MKKTLPILFIIIILMFIGIMAIPSLRTAVIGIQLAYDYIPGETLEYRYTLDMNTEMQMENAPEEMKSLMNVRQVSLTLQQLETRHIESVQGGIADILVTEEILDVKTTVDGEETSQSDNRIKEQKTQLKAKSTPTGEIIHLEIPPERELDGEILKETMKMTQRQIIFPDRVIKPGYEWTNKFNAPIQIGFTMVKMRGDIHYKFEKLTKYQGSNCALVSFHSNFTSDLTFAGQPEGENMSEMKGNIYFDISRGRIAFVENEMNLNSKMKLQSSAPGASESTDFVITGKSHIKSVYELQK